MYKRTTQVSNVPYHSLPLFLSIQGWAKVWLFYSETTENNDTKLRKIISGIVADA